MVIVNKVVLEIYRITLLSNGYTERSDYYIVLEIYRITLLSNNVTLALKKI